METGKANNSAIVRQDGLVWSPTFTLEPVLWIFIIY